MPAGSPPVPSIRGMTHTRLPQGSTSARTSSHELSWRARQSVPAPTSARMSGDTSVAHSARRTLEVNKDSMPPHISCSLRPEPTPSLRPPEPTPGSPARLQSSARTLKTPRSPDRLLLNSARSVATPRLPDRLLSSAGSVTTLRLPDRLQSNASTSKIIQGSASPRVSAEVVVASTLPRGRRPELTPGSPSRSPPRSLARMTSHKSLKASGSANIQVVMSPRMSTEADALVSTWRSVQTLQGSQSPPMSTVSDMLNSTRSVHTFQRSISPPMSTTFQGSKSPPMSTTFSGSKSPPLEEEADALISTRLSVYSFHGSKSPPMSTTFQGSNAPPTSTTLHRSKSRPLEEEADALTSTRGSLYTFPGTKSPPMSTTCQGSKAIPTSTTLHRSKSPPIKAEGLADALTSTLASRLRASPVRAVSRGISKDDKTGFTRSMSPQISRDEELASTLPTRMRPGLTSRSPTQAIHGTSPQSPASTQSARRADLDVFNTPWHLRHSLKSEMKDLPVWMVPPEKSKSEMKELPVRMVPPEISKELDEEPSLASLAHISEGSKSAQSLKRADALTSTWPKKSSLPARVTSASSVARTATPGEAYAVPLKVLTKADVLTATWSPAPLRMPDGVAPDHSCLTSSTHNETPSQTCLQGSNSALRQLSPTQPSIVQNYPLFASCKKGSETSAKSDTMSTVDTASSTGSARIDINALPEGMLREESSSSADGQASQEGSKPDTIPEEVAESGPADLAEPEQKGVTNVEVDVLDPQVDAGDHAGIDKNMKYLRYAAGPAEIPDACIIRTAADLKAMEAGEELRKYATIDWDSLSPESRAARKRARQSCFFGIF